jgi:putative Holliday junction resolvase
MLRGVRFGVDVGSVRIGVAKCDPDGMLATPLETIAAGETAIPKIIDLIKEHAPIAVYVGNPLSLNGQVTQSTIGASEFALALVSAIAGHPEIEEIEVRLIDERLSTVSAQRGLHEVGRTQKTSREVIDQAAAIIILEHALESEKRQGDFAGIEVVVANE